MSKAKEPIKIPFDKEGNMMSYEYTYCHNETVWKENKPFRSTLQIGSWSRGRSAATLYLSDVETGVKYPMFISEASNLLRNAPSIQLGVVAGVWDCIKRGENYSLRYLGCHYIEC